MTRFNQARDEEYAELIENVERFEDEVARESRKGKFTFAELEDIEADWEKVQRWHERIVARDFFVAAGRTDAGAALARGEITREAFTQAVYQHEEAKDERQTPVRKEQEQHS